MRFASLLRSDFPRVYCRENIGGGASGVVIGSERPRTAFFSPSGECLLSDFHRNNVGSQLCEAAVYVSEVAEDRAKRLTVLVGDSHG